VAIWSKVVTGDRIDWNQIKDRVDAAKIATAVLGPALGRRGERGRRLWWKCPLHQDRNPSFCVEPGRRWWKCFGCGEEGDAPKLIMKLNGVSFPEAVRIVADLAGIVTASGGSPRPRPPAKPAASKPERPPDRPPEGSTGLPLADALALVTEAAGRLWMPEGGKALAYLRGRRLTDATIKAARLGWTPGVMIPTREGDRSWSVSGVIIPWFDGDRLALVKIRQPEGGKPKYVEAFRDRPRIFPDSAGIEPGRPLVIAEGELDALLLGQALGNLAAVITMGSASSRPAPSTLGVMLAAAPWFVATDADEAGNKAASQWPARAIRVSPPEGKDWTEAAQAGIDLRRWWSDRLGGTEAPKLFSWEELAAQRWGPARDDPSPGIVIEHRGFPPSIEPETATLTEAAPDLIELTSDQDALAAMSRIIWDGSSVAESIEAGRLWNASILTSRTGREDYA
jgi:hypothetical protein